MPRYELVSKILNYSKIINHQYLGRFCRKNLRPQVYFKASKTAEDFVMPTSILLPKMKPFANLRIFCQILKYFCGSVIHISTQKAMSPKMHWNLLA